MGLFGTGILKGLGITLKHFIATYATDLKYTMSKSGLAPQPRPLRRQSPKNHGIVTVQYPAERLDLPENFRYIPFLVHDTTLDEIKCTSCGICAKVCPPQCIWIERTEDPVTKRPVPQPKDFFIDATICMNCGYCAEFCPFDAIKMDHDYELSYYPEQFPEARLVENKAMLLKPDTYHAAIHPMDWQREVDEKRASDDAKAKAAAAKAAPAAPVAAAPAPSAAPGGPPKAPPPSGLPPKAPPPPGAGGPPKAPPPPGAAASAGGPPKSPPPPGAGGPPKAPPPPGAAAASAGGPPKSPPPPGAGGPPKSPPPPGAGGPPRSPAPPPPKTEA
jgi:NADH-quinone oxidoreductase subunit I